MNAVVDRASLPHAPERSRFSACLVLAFGLHLALGLVLRAQHAGVATREITTEVELEPPPRAAALPEPPRAQEPPPPRAQAAVMKRVTSHATPLRANTPPPAAAAPLLTAPDDAAPSNSEPVRFVSDPNGKSYGFGVVARTPQHAPSANPSVSAKPALVITPPDQLERAPALVASDDCHGYFPERASADLAAVAVVAIVNPDGSLARLDVERETPAGQGFASAARACLRNQRYTAALDREGHGTRARMRVTIRFSR